MARTDGRTGGFDPPVGWRFAARVLQAVGAALLTPASLSIVLAAFPKNKRAVVVSLWGAVGGLAASVGPSAGSFVIDSFGWPWAFHINLPLGGLALWRGAVLLAESAQPTQQRRVDGVGMALLILAVGAVTLVPGLQPSYRRDWLPGLVMSGIAVGLVLPSLAAAAVSRLPVAHYAVGSAVNQATRQIGSVLGVAITVALLGHAVRQRAGFNVLYVLHAALALLTGLLCLPVETRPRATST